MPRILRNKIFFPAAAGIISGLVALGFIYRDGIAERIVNQVSDSNRQHVKQFIGRSAPEDVIVRIGLNNAKVPIKDLLNEQALIMTYQEGCPACRSAINHYLALREGRTDYGSSVYLLTDESNQRPPAGFPDRQFIAIENIPDDNMFDGRASPRIYRFKDGVLSDFMIGYQDSLLENWLTSMYGE